VTFIWRACLCFIAVRALSAADWKPVEPAELNRKEPVVEKDADAEAIFWDVRIGDGVSMYGGHKGLAISHYIRIKIYNLRGRNRQSNVDIRIPPGTEIAGVVGRTIRPDGAILELTKDAVFERVLNKTGDVRIKSKSFTMPGVEPGCIIEYQWTEERMDQIANHLRLDFQRDIPVRVVSYWIKPSSSLNLQMMIQDFQCRRTPPERNSSGYYVTTMSNVPAFKEEPLMPPAGELRAWALLYYTPQRNISDPNRFWTDHGKAIYDRYSARIKASKAVQRKAEEITAASKTDEDKLLAIAAFCKTGIKNSSAEASSAEERAEMEKKTYRTSDDTLKQGIGTPSEILFLFAALANAAGFETHIAEVPNRGVAFFQRNFPDTYFLNSLLVAVRLQGSWKFYDSVLFSPRSGLAWFHEGVEALISDSKEPVFVMTPLSRPEETVIHRQGNFRLTEDGTLEGDVVLEFGGHEAEVRKSQRQRESDAQLEEGLKNMLKRHASTAEFSEMKVENTSDPEKPLVYRCHLRVSGYAQRTGKRLFFAPSFFRQNVSSLFPLAERKYPVYFHYAWVEEDRITIELPAGFQLEDPRIPNPIPMGKLGEYEVHARIVNNTQFVFERRFLCGQTGNLLLPVALYPALKQAFDMMALADSQTMTLKQASAAGSN